MSDNLIESNSKFSFHLDGGHEIDTVLLIKIINDIAELTKIAAKAENPEAYLKLKVTTLRDGSFEIVFSAICNLGESLFDTAVSVSPLALNVVETVKGFFSIKKLLKGSKPRKISDLDDGRILVENTEGDKIEVNKASGNIIKDVKIDQLIVNMSNYSQEHNPSGGYTFSDDKGDLYCSVNDVKEMQQNLPIETSSTCRRWTLKTSLLIRKPDILGRSQWGFKYNGKSIDARIVDDDFIEYVQNGVQIRAGDYIDVSLEIYVDLDEVGNLIDGSEKYTVQKVYGGIKHKESEKTLF